MRLYLSVLFILVCTCLFGQSVTVIPVTVLPNVLMETSGLEKTGSNTFWSHNDSGNQPDIYAFDSSGTLTRTINVSNATNVDWEDITQDDNGVFYIGDFGNNNNDRSAANGTPLKIYIIPPPDQIGGSTTTAQSIVFEYEDRDFNAPPTNHNFDMEAFFFFNDSLHLFSKNRTNPTTGWVKHYILPATPGNYTAMLVDSFNNGGYRITSADIAPHKNTVALLAQDHVFLYTCFRGSKFLSTGHYTSIGITNTQKEGLVFATDYRVYITDEYLTSTVGQKLYRADLSAFISPSLQIGSVVVDSICPGLQNGEITVTPTGGYQPYTYTWSDGEGGGIIDSLAADTFNVHITDSHGCFVDSTIIVGEYTNLPSMTVFTQPSCPGDSSGAISIVIEGGVQPIDFIWSNGLEWQDLLYMPPGDIIVDVVDGNGCHFDSTFTIPAYDTIKPIISFYNDYLVSNNPDIAYWAQDSFLLASVNDTIYVGGLWADYTVTVVDSNGCYITSDVYHYFHIGLDNTAVPVDKVIISKNDNGYILNNTSNQNYTVQVYALDGRLVSSVAINAGSLQELNMPVDALHLFVFNDKNRISNLIR